jgi:hypothetical protein
MPGGIPNSSITIKDFRSAETSNYADLSQTTPQHSPSLPLDRGGGLRRDVVDDAVDASDLVRDAAGDARE